MYLIKLEASSNGGRPPLQMWDGNAIPEGYALCPAEFADIFYSTKYAGFVNIEIDTETYIVKSMSVNQGAIDAYIESLPEPEPLQPSPQDDMDSMMIDHEYRLTLLELGITE